MADQTPADPTTAILETIGTGIKGICENQKALGENQKHLLEKFPDEIGPLYDQLIQVTERLDQIERIIYDDDWQRRTETKNG